MSKNEVIFGWGAPPVKEQHPVLDDEVARQFDKDNEAVIRLSLRGLITQSAKEAVLRKLTKLIERELISTIRRAKG